MLLPYTPDYRWLLDRDDSPWYPSMRLFRQTETRDCVSVVDRVRSELATLVTRNSCLPRDRSGSQVAGPYSIRRARRAFQRNCADEPS